MSKPRRLDHVAIIVRSLEQSLLFYRDVLGLSVREVQEFPSEQVRIAFLPTGGPAGSDLELVEPLPTNESLQKFLSTRGEGLHHLCLEVEDVQETFRELSAQEVPLIGDQPRLAAEGKAIFIHPKGANGVLVELLEKAQSVTPE